MRHREQETREAAARQKAENRRAREEQAQKAEEAAARKEAALRAAFARKPTEPSISGHPVLGTVQEKAPRILRDPAFKNAIERCKSYCDTSKLATWEPKGKGGMTIFRSLCDHLLARYPMPSFLWNVFFEKDDALSHKLIPIVTKLAQGESLYKLCQDRIPLTRAMCHEVLTTKGDISLLSAIRRAQVKAVGGDARLHKIWMSTRCGLDLYAKPDEEFYATVLHWLAKNPMLDHAQVGPMIDYIQYRRRQDVNFTMKGRSVLAMMKGMEEWHGELKRIKVTHGMVFKPSGFQEATFDKSHNGKNGHVHEVWRCFEILTSKQLADEGRAMSHCVYSYSWSIEKGTVSIWSLTMEDSTGNWRMLTVEVRNDTRQIVQARGRFNRPADTKTYQVLQDWASKNSLVISAGRLLAATFFDKGLHLTHEASTFLLGLWSQSLDPPCSPMVAT